MGVDKQEEVWRSGIRGRWRSCVQQHSLQLACGVTSARPSCLAGARNVFLLGAMLPALHYDARSTVTCVIKHHCVC
jgi:hypothetical protein